jgi:SnoaL-like protein
MKRSTVMTTQEVADRYHELAKQGKWFEIQDELFDDDVKSIEPAAAPSQFRYLHSAEGKANVRRKAEEWVSRVETLHSQYFSAPVVGGNHFALAWGIDADVAGIGRRKIDEIMLYEVKDGRIVLERFFY